MYREVLQDDEIRAQIAANNYKIRWSKDCSRDLSISQCPGFPMRLCMIVQMQTPHVAFMTSLMTFLLPRPKNCKIMSEYAKKRKDFPLPLNDILNETR